MGSLSLGEGGDTTDDPSSGGSGFNWHHFCPLLRWKLQLMYNKASFDGESGQDSRDRGKQGWRSARTGYEGPCRGLFAGYHGPKTPISPLNRSRTTLADLAIGDRILGKADGGRRPESIWEISAKIPQPSLWLYEMAFFIRYGIVFAW